MEECVIVNEKGIITGFKDPKSLELGENKTVELVMVVLPTERRLVLFNRGIGSSDMHDHWALESGKVNRSDIMLQNDVIGQKLSLQAFKKAAQREFMEELNFPINTDHLRVIDEFHMPMKQTYFVLFMLPITQSDFLRLSPDRSEVSMMKQFSLAEFETCSTLGDAIVFRKERITGFITQLFEAQE